MEKIWFAEYQKTGIPETVELPPENTSLNDIFNVPDVISTDYNFERRFNYTFAYRKIDISLLAGLGLALPLGERWAITAEGRYFRGFVSLPDDILRPEQQNFGFTAALGMRYVIK